MYFTKATTVVLLSALSLATAMPALDSRQNGVTCQTSDGSPKTGKVTNAINELKGRGGDCPNTNGSASDCTTLVNADGGKIGVCGEVDDDSSELSCKEVADYANQVQQTCMSNGNVGGTFTVSAGKKIIVF
ncbi:hypothetical protein EV127DRAFT_414427 [Xylaria flabelliformis]|nr:hypothetical protein EV127DRAFT_414427 [Xylaria flabelliformis]